jgi:1-acyl-sn-glycerol-3-phosphate acyltransferase
MRTIFKHFCRIVLRIAGWKFIRTVPEVKKSVVCVAPHTSNWDFILAKLSYTATGDAAPSFFMKKEWFFFPLGVLLRAMHGIPVDRSKRTSLTEQVAAEFAKRDTFHIGITPEGTRKAVKEWKKGFYQIAIKAEVPIQLAYLDYGKKECGITELFYPTGDEKADIEFIQGFYKNVTARFPERFHKQSKSK